MLADEGEDLLVEEALITVFNLENIDDEKKAAAGMVCSEAVWSRAARDRGTRIDRLVVSDETWLMLMHPAGAQFMMNTAKRARKHRMGWLASRRTSMTFLWRTLLKVWPATAGAR